MKIDTNKRRGNALKKIFVPHILNFNGALFLRKIGLFTLFFTVTSFAFSQTTTYTVITGLSSGVPGLTAGGVSESELQRRVNLQEYNDVITYLRRNSSNIIEASGVSFDRLTNILVNVIGFERRIAENDIRNIGNGYRVVWNRSPVFFNVNDWVVYLTDSSAQRLNSAQTAQSHFNRGNEFFNRRDYDMAILEFIDAIRLDPNFAQAHNNRGNAYLGKRDYDRAIADYT